MTPVDKSEDAEPDDKEAGADLYLPTCRQQRDADGVLVSRVGNVHRAAHGIATVGANLAAVGKGPRQLPAPNNPIAA